MTVRDAMKRKRHHRTEILLKVRKAEADLAAGIPFEEICTAQQVSAATLKRWLREHGQPPPDGHARLNQLEHENRRLRKALANLEFDKRVLSETLRGNF